MGSQSGKGTICHKGIVTKTGSSSTFVTITSESACRGCHAEEMCTLSGKDEKIIEIEGFYAVKPGDEVSVGMTRAAGFSAVLISYVIPLCTVVTVLIILMTLEFSELAAGLYSISTLIPYYLFLFLIRKKLNKRFVFTIND